MSSEGIQGDEWDAQVALGRMTSMNVGSSTGRESYDDGDLVVVAGVTPARRTGKAVHIRAKGGQVIRTLGKLGGMRNAERRNGAGCPA